MTNCTCSHDEYCAITIVRKRAILVAQIRDILLKLYPNGIMTATGVQSVLTCSAGDLGIAVENAAMGL